LDEMGTNLYRRTAQLVRINYRLESHARWEGPTEHWAISVWRCCHHSFPDKRDHAQRPVLGIRPFRPVYAPRSAPVRFPNRSAWRGSRWHGESGRTASTGAEQFRRRPKGNPADGRNVSGCEFEEGFSHHPSLGLMVHSLQDQATRPIPGLVLSAARSWENLDHFIRGDLGRKYQADRWVMAERVGFGL